MVPAVPTRCKHHDLRLEACGIIQRADIDSDQVGYVLRLVIDRRSTLAAESLALRGAAVGGSRIFDDLPGDLHGRAREHCDRRMSRPGIPLAVAALAVKAPDRLGHDLVV